VTSETYSIISADIDGPSKPT